MLIRFLPIALASLFLFSCSTITSKDCEKDMKTLGLTQGKAGSPKKYTDDLRNKCMGKNPTIDLESYEIGFYQGWSEYCLPNKALEMGKRSDRYFSFCPPERESSFREKYLIGKHIAELKDVEIDLQEKIDEIKPTINENTTNLDNYNKLLKEFEKIKREIQTLEVEGLKNNFRFR